jgi:hypothetical protein
MLNNNNPPQEEELNPEEIRRLHLEVHEFKKTFLYTHFKSCQKLLYEETVSQIIDEPLKSAETLYVREGWIGEARSVKELYHWFDNLQMELEKQVREQEQ